jgi:DNA-binding LytR/AlgR family response regulator
MKLKCMIIDDEPAGRKVLEEYVGETPFLELSGSAEHPMKAVELMTEHPVDLIFLDIEMPKMNGIDFLRTFRDPPMVIMSTAFSEYALQGFELDVIDYLLKPVSFERFVKACNKAREFHELRHSATAANRYFFVKCNQKYEKVNYDDLLFVEAANNYIILQLQNKRLITYLTFKGMEDILPKDLFMRVHKSFMVSIPKIESLDAEGLRIGTHAIPISRNLKEEVLDRTVKRHLVKRL